MNVPQIDINIIHMPNKTVRHPMPGVSMHSTKERRIEVVIASQFFVVGGRTWGELRQMAGKNDGIFFAHPDLRTAKVTPEETPLKGDVWYREGSGGKPEVYKANYDSSD